MFLIPRKRIWTQQPQGAAQVISGDSITDKLVLAQSMGNTLYDGFSRRNTVVGTKKQVANVGLAAGFGSLGLGSTDSITTSLKTHATQRTYFVIALATGTGAGNGSGRLIEKRTAGAQSELLYRSESTNRFIFGRVFSGGGGEWYTIDSALGVYHKYAVRYDSSSASNSPLIDIDGISQTVVTGASTSGSPVNTTDSYVIGNRTNDNARNWSGSIALVLIWDRLLSDVEIESISENHWQIFLAPDSPIFVPFGAGAPAGAVLTGNAQAQATATGNLTLKADLDAVALSVATASGNLTTFIPLTGAAVAIGSASGALTSGIKLSAAATASALVSGSLVAQIKLNGAALAQAAASAGLTSAILLAGSGQGQATASGTLAADPGSMSGNAQAQASAVATLTTSIRLSGAAAAQAGVSGILTTNISLTAAALAQAIATGTLAVPILLAGAAHGVATATGNLTAPDSATAVYFRLASSVQRLTKAACTAQRLTTIKHEVQHA